MSLEKARIMNLDTGEVVTALFNPKEYTFSKSNSWGGGEQGGSQANAGELKFTSGQNISMKLQLVFDTYHMPSTPDVRSFTDGLWKMMKIDKSLTSSASEHGRPPKVKFFWGTTWGFDAVIENLSQQFTMFLPNGLPVRAIVDMTLKEVRDHEASPFTNPTSGGIGGERVHLVRQGDTLARIAEETMGSARHWRAIAEFNNLESVRDLSTGSSLFIPV
jgi:nucleoid-associated protein YgaU